MRRIAHIVNPVLVPQESRLHLAQQVAFESMALARNFAQDQVFVDFFSAQYPEDHQIVPDDFQRTPDLDRSVLDLGEFKKPRKLPVMRDILDRLYHASEADYFIYTNVDIGLIPGFYLVVDQFIESGYDAFTINRRTISDHYDSLTQLPLMYADLGEPHRGWDCFIFRREIYPKFKLGDACIGAPLIGLLLISNLLAYGRRFRQYLNEHLTFHLGNDRSWHDSPFADYAHYNQKEILRLLREIDREIDGFERGTPPERYLYFHKTHLRAFLYERLMRTYIPAKFTRPIMELLGRKKTRSES
jgi:hypothetical protein